MTARGTARGLGLLTFAALALAGCGEGVQTRGAATTDADVASRPAIGQAAVLARVGTMSRAPLAQLADPEAGPRALAEVGEELDELTRRSERIGDGVERTAAPLPRRIIAAAKLQQRAFEAAAKLAGRLGGLEEEANRDRAPTKRAQAEMTSLVTKVEDLRPLAADVAALQHDHLVALRRLLDAARRAAAHAGVASPDPRTRELRVDPQLRERLTAAVGSASQRMSSLVAALAPAPVTPDVPENVVVPCGDDPGLYRIQALNLSCADANQLARAAAGALAPTFSVYGYSCEILGTYAGPRPGVFSGADDVLCRQGRQAFQFDFSG